MGAQLEFRPMYYYRREFFVLVLRFIMKITELCREICNTRKTIQPQIMVTFPLHSVLATGWKFRGSNPGGDEVFRTHRDRPWCPPNLLYNGKPVSFPGGKEAGTWPWSPTPI